MILSKNEIFNIVKSKFRKVYSLLSPYFKKKDINYYENFEDQNNIIPLFDEVNSISYFSTVDVKKINEILKNKIKSENNFKLVGTYIPKKYITVENRDEYHIDFPYLQKYYKKENGKWIFLFEKI
ncbi:hypothetical protein [Chryseobacterium indoltheticum]|uniref:hypothetical protein n=1 Tax=Chryseobacterium indoltheticum TaxID=254 RepID=UPI003F49B15C